jgi:hypothetical protein
MESHAAAAPWSRSLKVTVHGRGNPALKEKLRKRIEAAEQLKCSEHGKHVVALTINDLENGWFDCRWTTCCDQLEQQAAGILKRRA